MRLLLDTCVWGGACKELQAEGHDVIWAGEWLEDPGDDEILERAYREDLREGITNGLCRYFNFIRGKDETEGQESYCDRGGAGDW